MPERRADPTASCENAVAGRDAVRFERAAIDAAGFEARWKEIEDLAVIARAADDAHARVCRAAPALHRTGDRATTVKTSTTRARARSSSQGTDMIDPRRGTRSPPGLQEPHCRRVLTDNDPWGFYIDSVIKQGSINLAYESMRMAVPKARFLGLSSFDADRFHLKANVSMALTDEDDKRADQLLKYEWFADKRWQDELNG